MGVDLDALMASIRDDGGYLTSERGPISPMFYRDVPATLVEADSEDATFIPSGLFAAALTPGVVSEQAGRIIVPVLHINAAHDVSPNPRAELACYRSARHLTLYEQPGAAHCNFEPSRAELYGVVANWVHSVAASTLGVGREAVASELALAAQTG
jgi:hypothetical protein